MTDREKVIKGFELCLETIDSPDCPDNCPYLSICKKYENRVILQPLMRDALELLKEQRKAMSPEEFRQELLNMFSSIWDCEIEHPLFQDTVGGLMDAVAQLYQKAVNWDG